MSKIEKKFEFNASAEKVWKHIIDVEKTPQWVKGVESSKITSADKSGKGLRWEERVFIDAQPIMMEHEFTEWNENESAEINTKLPMGAWMKKILKFESIGNKTEMKLEVNWDLGILGSFFPADKIQTTLDKSFEVTFENLKKILN